MTQAPPPPLDSVLVAAGKLYPGVRCLGGLRDPFLVMMAQDYAEQMAAINSQSRGREGHFGWNRRSREIREILGMRGAEVTAESWPWQKDISEIGQEMFYCWERSPGHWKIVSQEHDRFGDGLAKSKQGIWYSCLIVAD